MKTVNKLCFCRGLYLIEKTFLLFHTALLKCFIYSSAGILESPWCNNPCQGGFYSFDQEKVPFLLIYLLPTHKKCNNKKNHTYPNLIYSMCYRVYIYRLVKLLTSSFYYLLLFLVTYPPSATTLRFPHSSSTNISLGKSIKFPIPSISIPSSSSPTWKNFVWGVFYLLKWRRDFLR